MGSQGQLTSEKVIEAILASGASVDDEFGKMPTTIGQALTQIETAWDYTTMQIERKSNVFGRIANYISNQILDAEKTIRAFSQLVDSNQQNSGDSIGALQQGNGTTPGSMGGLQQLNQLQQEHPILSEIYNIWLQIKTAISDIGVQLQPIFGQLSNADFTNLILAGFSKLKELISTISPLIIPVITATIDMIKALMPIISDLAPMALNVIKLIGTGFGVIIKIILLIADAITWLFETFPTISEAILVLGAIIFAAFNAPLLLVLAIIGAVVAAFFWLRDNISTIFAAIGEFIEAVWNGIKASAEMAANWLVSKFDSAVSDIKSFFTDLYNTVVGILQNISSAIGTYVLDKIKSAKDAIMDFLGWSNKQTSQAVNDNRQAITQNLGGINQTFVNTNPDQYSDAIKSRSGNYLEDIARGAIWNG